MVTRAERAQELEELANKRNETLGVESQETVPTIGEDYQPSPPPPTVGEEEERELTEEEKAKADDEAPLPNEPKEGVSQNGTEDESPPETDKTSEAPPSLLSEEPKEAAPVAPFNFDAEAEVEVVVDGQTVKVPASKIVDAGLRTYSKEAAAELRLNLATRVLEEAKRKAAELPQEGARPEPRAEEPAVEGPTDEELADMLQFGSKEQAAKALAILRNTGKAAKPEEVMAFVHQNLGSMVADEIEFRQAVATVKDEFKDLLSNSYRITAFQQQAAALRATPEGQAMTHLNLLRRVGSELEKAFNVQRAAPKTKEEKQERKKETPTPPTPASARMQGKGPEKIPTTRDIIAGIAAARGQTSLVQRKKE